MIKVELTEAIKAHGKEITELEFREPRSPDFDHCGYPLQIIDGGAVPIPSAISKYIKRLADIPASSVAMLNPKDYRACMAEVLGFFAEEEEIS